MSWKIHLTNYCSTEGVALHVDARLQPFGKETTTRRHEGYMCVGLII